MARVQLKCDCGWVFFVAEITPNGVNCPHCRAPVVAAHTAGRRRTAGEVAAEKQSRTQMLTIGFSILGVVVLVGGVVMGFVFSGKGYTPKTTDPKIRIIEEVEKALPSAKREEEARRPDVPAPKFEHAKDHRRIIDMCAWMCNVAGVTGELLRVRGDAAKAKDLEERMADYERAIEEGLDKLRERNESHLVPEHMLPTDRILFFRSVDFSKASKADREKVLGTALRQLRAGDSWDIAVNRGGDAVGFLSYFKERPKELLAIVQQYAGILGGTGGPTAGPGPTPGPDDPGDTEPAPPPTPPPPPPPKPVDLPADVLTAVKEKVLKAPAYYQSFLSAEERERMNVLVKEGKGLPDDLDFLRGRVLTEAWNEMQDEVAFIRSMVTSLKEKSSTATSGTDVLIKKDGSRLDGRVLEEKDDVVKFEFVRGTLKGAVTVRHEDIQEIRRGAGAATEFAPKLDAAKGKAAGLLELMAWCKERGLAVHREYVSYLLLEIEPGSEAARTALGYQKTENGTWTKEREARRSGDKIEYAGKAYTLPEFTAMLKSRGYTEINGKWYGKKAWSLKVANLYRDDGKLRLSNDNTGVMERVRTDKSKTYDVLTKSYKDVFTKTTLGRGIMPFGSGTSAKGDVYGAKSGTVTILLEAPGEFIELRVKAAGEVAIPGASIRVTAMNDGGATKQLYYLSSIGRVDKQVDVTEIAKGRRSIMIKAEMASPFISNDTGTVMFLPSTKSDTGVFEASGQIADALEGINQAILNLPPPSDPKNPGADPKNPGVRPDPKPMDRDAVVANIAAAADAIIATSDSLDIVLSRMRDSTVNLRYPDAMPAMPEFDPLLKYVTDPLTFDLKKVSSQAAVEVGTWWSRLPAGDRKRFAIHYGLVCAYARHKGK
jgi:hypothetical protein